MKQTWLVRVARRFNRLAPTATAAREAARTRIGGAHECAPGLLFCVVLAAAAMFIAQSYGGSPILYALLLGVPFNFLADDDRLKAGVTLAGRGVLRLGVALLGARITIEQIGAIGLPTMLSVVIAVVVTIVFGWFMADWFGLPRRFGLLSAGATAICGASAAAALSSVLPRYPDLERDTAFTIVGVTTLSTIAMVVYPVVARWLDLDGVTIGIILGATIHDVAQVVGAAYSVSTEAGDKATIVKLFRVALLLPLVFAIALIGRWLSAGNGRAQGPLIPWFLIAFTALVAINSTGLLPRLAGTWLAEASHWCILVSIAALGVKTALQSLSAVGRPAVALMIAETVFIATFFVALLLLVR